VILGFDLGELQILIQLKHILIVIYANTNDIVFLPGNNKIDKIE